MPDALRCTRCSAPLEDAFATACTSCGAAFAPSLAPGSDAARLAAVARSPRYPELMQRTPSGTGWVVMYGFLVVFGAAWTVVTGLIALGGAGLVSLSEMGPLRHFAVPAAAGLPFVLVPALMAALGAVGFVLAVRQLRRFLAAPTERVVSLVRDERTEVTGKLHDRKDVSTQHYLLLEAQGGARTEYLVDASLAGRVATGDVGVAYVRAGTLLDFQVVAPPG